MSSDEHLNSPAIPVGEFEGQFIRTFEGRLGALTLDMPEGYLHGTHLKLELEARVRNVSFVESKGKERDMIRHHELALEEIRLIDAFDPAHRPSNVGGNAAGNAWEEQFLDFVHGDTDLLDFEGNEIPDRLRDMLKVYFDSLSTGVEDELGF